MGNNQQPQTAQVMNYMQPYYAEDEISLVDLWIAISAYKKVFFSVFGVVLLSALAFIFFVFQEKYQVSSSFQVGKIKTSDHKLLQIEASSVVKSKLESVILPIETANMIENKKVESTFKTSIKNAKDSDVFLIQNKVKASDIALYKEFQQKVLAKIVQDHENLMEQSIAQLKNQIKEQQLKLRQFQHKDTLDLMIEAAEEQYILTLSTALRDVGNQLTKVELSASQKQWIRKKTTKKYYDDIQLKKLAIEQLETKLKLIDKTRPLQQGVVSLKPVGLTRNILILLSVFSAGFIAFIVLLVVMFRDKVQQRLAEEN